MTNEEAIDILVRLPLLHICTRDPIDKVSDALSMAIEALEEGRPHGKWIRREDMDYLDENKVVHNHFECNECGYIHDFIDGHTAQYNFCPSCGSNNRWRGDEK